MLDYVMVGEDARFAVLRADSRGVGPAAQHLVHPPGLKPKFPAPWEWQVDVRAAIGWVLIKDGYCDTPEAAEQAARAAIEKDA